MNSIVISFILSFVQNIIKWFDGSVFHKIQKGTKNFWLRITKNSLFVSWFSKFPKKKEILENSFLFSIVSKIVLFFKNIILWFINLLKDTYLITTIRNWYKDFFVMSIANYCYFVLGLVVTYSIGCLFINALTTKMVVILSIVAIISIIGIVINKSLLSLFSNSWFVDFVCKLFDYKLPSIIKTKENTKSSIFTHLFLGVILGLATGITQNYFILLIPIALLGAGVVLLEYRITLFTTMILMPFLPTMGVVALTLVSFMSFVLKFVYDKNMKFIRTPLDIPIGIFTVIMGISAVTSFARNDSIKVFLVYFAFVLGYYLIVNSIKSKRQLKTLLYAILVTSIGVALYGIIQYIFGFEEGRIWTDNQMFTDIKTRVVSTFENPNVLGEYLLLLIPISLGYMFSERSKYRITMNLGTIILLALCMVFTYSRGNWLGLVIAVALFFMFYNGKFIWCGLLLALFLPIFMPETIINRFMSIGDTADTSTSYRVHIWIGTLRMLKDYWLTGVGLGTKAFETIYPYYAYNSVLAQHPHNLYLNIFSENGVWGLIAFVVIILIYYKMCISTIIKNKTDKFLNTTVLGLSAGMFGFLVQGLFDNVFYNYRIVFMFYMILALTVSSIVLLRTEKEK